MNEYSILYSIFTNSETEEKKEGRLVFKERNGLWNDWGQLNITPQSKGDIPASQKPLLMKIICMYMFYENAQQLVYILSNDKGFSAILKCVYNHFGEFFIVYT